jgi:hypothetical protein
MDNLIALFVELVIGSLIFGLCIWGIREGVDLIHDRPPPALQLRPLVRFFLIALLIILSISFLLGVAGYWGTWGWGHHWRAGRL